MKKLFLFTLALSLGATLAAQTTTVFQQPTVDRLGICYNFASPAKCGEEEFACWHTGKDYCGNKTDAVFAAGSGKVVSVRKGPNEDDNRGLGNTVVIAHKMDGADNLYTLYAHLNSIASDVTVGKFVPKGHTLGYQGTSGSSKQKPTVHLHFEMKNHADLGHQVDCKGAGCVGYVKESHLPVTSRGYHNPDEYIGKKKYLDISVGSNLPASIPRSGVNISVTINSPFTNPIAVGIRLALYKSSGDYLGDIKSYTSVELKPGDNTVAFAKTSLSSPTALDYKLQVDYRAVASTSKWVPMPAIAPARNPMTVMITP